MKMRHKKMARAARRVCQETYGPSWGWKWSAPSMFALLWSRQFRSTK